MTRLAVIHNQSQIYFISLLLKSLTKSFFVLIQYRLYIINPCFLRRKTKKLILLINKKLLALPKNILSNHQNTVTKISS